MPHTQCSSYAAICSCEHGHGTGKQIKAYHVAANPNRRQTKEHEPRGGRAGHRRRKTKKKKRKKNREHSTHGRKKILSIDYQSTFGHRVRVRKEKQKQKAKSAAKRFKAHGQAVLGNARFLGGGKVVGNTSAGNWESALRLS